MIKFLKKRINIFHAEPSLAEQSRVNAENEYLAMSCGSFSPRLLARIKSSKAEHNRP
jgi:hypothetical protein